MADYSHKKFAITKLTKSIFKLEAFEGIELLLEDVMDMHKAFLELSQGKKYAVLMDATKYFSPSDKARAKIASKQFTNIRYATAFVVASLANRLIGNLFIRFNKPATPTRIFNNETSALEWLKEEEKTLYAKNK